MIPNLPHVVATVGRRTFEMEAWCTNNIGPKRASLPSRAQREDGVWTVRWNGQYDYGYTWYFKEERDAIVFALRWT